MNLRRFGSAPRNDFGGATLASVDRVLSLPRIRFDNRHVVFAGSLVLLLPNIVFAFALGRWPAIVMLFGSLGFGILAWRAPVATGTVLSQPVGLVRLGACALTALVLLVLGGETHLFYANWDWLWRDAVLADLSRGPLLPTYDVAGNLSVLRAPLGMYLVPALVGRGIDLASAHVALLAQNTLLLTLVLYLLATMAGRRAGLVIFVFLSFSGLDVLGEVMRGSSLGSLPSHIEWWAGAFQYSSVVTQLFWCPNHALPAYWLTVLALMRSRREIDMASFGIATAASLLWSPFAVIGILPFAIYLVLSDQEATIASKRSWYGVAVALTFLPVALYLKADAAQVPREFLLFAPGMALLILVFLLVEIPHAAFVAAAWRGLDPALRGLVCVAVPVLVVLPTVRIGLANDFVMRASIPALMILAIAFANALATAWPTRPILCGAGAVLVLLGAITPLKEIARSFALASFKISDCNLVTVWRKVGRNQPTLENYLAKEDAMPAWLLAAGHAAPLADQSSRTCWPDLPIDPYLRIIRLTNADLRRLSLGHPPL